MAKAKKTKGMASVLAFEKKLVFSDGYMYGTTWSERGKIESPIRLVEKAVRGTHSDRLNAEVEKANLQVVDAASLLPEQDTLKLSYTLKILPGIEYPSACNDELHQQNIYKMVTEYIDEFRFEELARRYASNIASARFLWRNRVGAESVETHASVWGTDKSWVFDSLRDLSMNEFDENYPQIKELAEIIAETLSGRADSVTLEIITYAKLGKGQEVYPSEELVLDKGRGKKSKILYSINEIAAMHSQKLGNAIRTIDTWYPGCSDNDNRPIAIETYGTVTNLGKAYRTTSEKKDFYTLFDKWSSGENLADKVDKHYVMAVLVRGGVFGKSEKDGE